MAWIFEGVGPDGTVRSGASLAGLGGVIVLVAQRYRKDAGVGTIISLMIPYTLIVLVAWLLFFAAWFALGIPMGPGYPASL